MTKAVIEKRLRDFLDLRRKSPGFTDDQHKKLLQEHVDFVLQSAPAARMEEWGGVVVENLMTHCSGVSFPGPGDIRKACVAATVKIGKVEPKPADARSQADKARDSFIANVNAGEGVPEHQIFGLVAQQCLRDGFVTQERVRQYQLAAYKQRERLDKRSARRWLEVTAPHLIKEFCPVQETPAVRQPHAD